MKRFVKSFQVLVESFLVALFLFGCAHVTPVVDERESASFDGNIPDSGIMEILPDESLHISASARDRYNGLIDDFGDQYSPALKRDHCVTKLDDGTYAISKEGAECWYRLVLIQEAQRVESSDSIWKKIKP